MVTSAERRAYELELDVARATWPSGPWNDEPNRIEWSYGGVACLALRMPTGAWSGYIGVAPGHPWYGLDEGELCEVKVHGGVTLTCACDTLRCCHVDQSCEPALWWIGFACLHAGDLSPIEVAWLISAGFQPVSHWGYRDVRFITNEVDALAQEAVRAMH